MRIAQPEKRQLLTCGERFMADYKRKLTEDAQALAEFGQGHKYLRDAFWNVFGQRIILEGYVDGNYILAAKTKGTYYSQLQDSRIRPLYAKACVVSEYIETMLEYLESIVPDGIKLNQLEQEALVFWIFLPYIAISKWEKRKFYLLQVLEQFLQMKMCDYAEEENPEWELCEIEGVIFN